MTTSFTWSEAEEVVRNRHQEAPDVETPQLGAEIHHQQPVEPEGYGDEANREEAVVIQGLYRSGKVTRRLGDDMHSPHSYRP